jgi:flavin reductase (DIM6/NTAB) family NADH-FMN oxidoreductase RutF
MQQRTAIPAGKEWKKHPVREFNASPFVKIGDEWMLINAGDGEDWNTMTASWGGLGVLWGMDVAFVFVRPTRHTFSYMEKSKGFSLSFFDPAYKKALSFCGSASGRDTDKAAGAGLTPILLEKGCISFAEARETLRCRTLYSQDLSPAHFLDPSLETHYPKKDYHRLYVGCLEGLYNKS